MKHTEDNEQMKVSARDTGTMLTGMIIGGIIGVAAAFLLAPQSGPDTRRLLRDKGLELKDRAELTVEETRLRAGQTLADSRAKAEETVKDFRNKAEEAVNQARQSAAEVARQAEQKLAQDE